MIAKLPGKTRTPRSGTGKLLIKKGGRVRPPSLLLHPIKFQILAEKRLHFTGKISDFTCKVFQRLRNAFSSHPKWFATCTEVFEKTFQGFGQNLGRFFT